MLHKLQHPQSILIAKDGLNESQAIKKVEDMGFDAHFKPHPHQTKNFYRFRQYNPVQGEQFTTEHLNQHDLAITDKYHNRHPLTRHHIQHKSEPALKHDNLGNSWIPNIQKIGDSFHDLNRPKYHIPNQIIKKGAEKMLEHNAKNLDLERLKNVVAEDIIDEKHPKQIIKDVGEQAKQIAINKIKDTTLKRKIGNEIKDVIVDELRDVDKQNYKQKAADTAKKIGQITKHDIINRLINKQVKNKFANTLKDIAMEDVDDINKDNVKQKLIEKGVKVAKEVGKKVANKIGERLLTHKRHQNKTSKIGKARHAIREYIGRKLKNV